MKKTLLVILATALSHSGFTQFKNESFETKKDHSLAPSDWNFTSVAGYTGQRDDSISHSGKSSFKLTGSDQIKANTFQNVSQLIAYETKGFEQIQLSGYVKLKEVEQSLAFWCQVWDKDNKMIGFENIQSQQPVLKGSSEWKQYSLRLSLPKETKKLYFGVYLMGKGTAWIDDFTIEKLDNPYSPPSEEITRYISEVRKIIKENSIYRDSLNWADIDEGIKFFSSGLKTVTDAAKINSYILSTLKKAGDNHSFFQTRVNAQKYASENTNPEKTTSALLENNMGYIQVPGFGSLDKKTMDEFANDIQQQICRLDTANQIQGWVVDLRKNTGGNMYPMIAGLGPLISTGELGYFVYPDEKKTKYHPWTYTSSDKPTSTMGITISKPYQIKNKDSKVAVLIGPRTSSSGEMTTISFIGKAHTKLFGEPTGGYTTANRGFKLADGSYLYLASSYTADRNKKEYRGKIQPDVLIKPSGDGDEVLKAAVKWLSEK
ncbi:hypothetical protein CA265_11810 [Sphingobacteriaceae bacterium GW460-11-11-14-LB5]|nr:hypothetical protein CA265_11810 [Sphingobacteriaceae bacterium GW460-11-11-14-LB5]